MRSVRSLQRAQSKLCTSTSTSTRSCPSSSSFIKQGRQFSTGLGSPVGGVTNNTVSLVSIPLAIGQPYVGPDTSPNLLKKNGLLQLLGDCGWRVDQMPDVLEVTSNDVGSIDMSNLNAKNCASIGATCEVAAKVIYEKAMNDNFILILGGDHSIPIGTIPGLMKARPNTGVVWVDAHADINVPKSSPSGNMHGMPVSFLMGLVEEAKKYPSMSWFEACLKPQDLCYIGLRDLDTPEKELIRSLGIKAYSMYDVDRLGIGMVMEQTKDYFADKSHLHLSYDIDALDPFFAPSTGTAVRGGLTFREGNYICESLCETGKLASLELVEVNPSLHSNVDAQSTVDMALTLLGSSMGQRIL